MYKIAIRLILIVSGLSGQCMASADYEYECLYSLFTDSPARQAEKTTDTDTSKVALVKKYLQSARAGDVRAATRIGLIFLPPANQADVDCIHSEYWLYRGAKGGDDLAALMLAILYSLNPGIAPSAVLLNGYWQEAASSQNHYIRQLANTMRRFVIEQPDAHLNRDKLTDYLLRQTMKNSLHQLPSVEYRWVGKR